MRGPYERLKYDFSRVWECPNCRRQERTDFTTTFHFCRCRVKEAGGPLVCMRLAADGVRRVLGPVCRPRPEIPPRSTPEEGNGMGQISGAGRDEPPRHERYGKPKFEQRGRGGERQADRHSTQIPSEPLTASDAPSASPQSPDLQPRPDDPAPPPTDAPS